MSAPDAADSLCAACGEGGDGLKQCTACELVMYCNRSCQKAHRPMHKRECASRAAELFDEKLFQTPPRREDCPICCLRLPNIGHSSYQACCGNTLCNGCLFQISGEVRAGRSKHFEVYNEAGPPPCPFCRAPAFQSYEEGIARLHARMSGNDATAFLILGCYYMEGQMDLEQDIYKAIDLLTRAKELGSIEANSLLGNIYNGGRGIERDIKKAVQYWQTAAMGGDEVSRFNLAVYEGNRGNVDRAKKHYMIAAGSGYDRALERIREDFVDGWATKDEYEMALRAHKDFMDDIKSGNRDKAAAVRKQIVEKGRVKCRKASET